MAPGGGEGGPGQKKSQLNDARAEVAALEAEVARLQSHPDSGSSPEMYRKKAELEVAKGKLSKLINAK